ncbi:MAG: enolase C-terminal domain-like protein [Chloroflexota bacterium]
MAISTRIVAVDARQVYTDRGHPGVEARVTTENGALGVAMCTAGVSVGAHEVPFTYDGGSKWQGRGVQKAVENIKLAIAPALVGVDAAYQSQVDECLLNVGGPGAKARLGGNAVAAVSAAALKAGAAALGIPLYQHIGGVNACVLPVPGIPVMVGSRRYGGGQRSGGKPSYCLMCYGFATFSEASYAGWELLGQFEQALARRFGVETRYFTIPSIPIGSVQHERELWDLMVETIAKTGYEGKVGIQVDIAAGTYFDKERGKFVGLFSAEDKSREELIELYRAMVREYPFVIVEDPLDEDDYEGHALLTRELGVELVGDDLFTTNVERVQWGIEAGAANTVLLKVNQIGSVSEAFEMVRLAYRHGYGVMPCSSRGEGADIADYTVGLNAGHLRPGAVGPIANRLLQIEAELGPRGGFAGRSGLKP